MTHNFIPTIYNFIKLNISNYPYIVTYNYERTIAGCTNELINDNLLYPQLLYTFTDYLNKDDTRKFTFRINSNGHHTYNKHKSLPCVGIFDKAYNKPHIIVSSSNIALNTSDEDYTIYDNQITYSVGDTITLYHTSHVLRIFINDIELQNNFFCFDYKPFIILHFPLESIVIESIDECDQLVEGSEAIGSDSRGCYDYMDTYIQTFTLTDSILESIAIYITMLSSEDLAIIFQEEDKLTHEEEEELILKTYRADIPMLLKTNKEFRRAKEAYNSEQQPSNTWIDYSSKFMYEYFMRNKERFKKIYDECICLN